MRFCLRLVGFILFCALLIVLSGCSGLSCYVGVSLLPPGPFVTCGKDIPIGKQKDDGEDEPKSPHRKP